MTVEPGQTLRFRYRVIVHPGDARSAGIAGPVGDVREDEVGRAKQPAPPR